MTKLLVEVIVAMPKRIQHWLCFQRWFMKWVVKNEAYFRERRN